MRSYLKEFFSQFDILATGLVWCAGMVYVVPELDRGWVWLSILAGMVGYACNEYLIHRFFFHLKPPKNPYLLKLLKRLHYDHHVDPQNLKLLFLPVWYSFPIIFILSFLAYSVTGDPLLAVSFSVGVISYLLYYEWMHYIAHRPVKPMTAWGRYMKRVHLWHHFKNEHYWFGVTHPFLDMGLGTYKDHTETEQSKTVRNLEGKRKSS
ncbi:sterol desaturase family protein [Melghirimyces algeriensis]|uniref:Fatty acid hydroxylase superfamily protein n=1 Tax=Melghirimyces algeriensis TaxID=910412 RepID=A0A521C0T4_9BACL|nr:sterol desaturase family protein [Melghirimyces algeriensis]SMO53076.1 Fatty acid hydroxylase superfamily protein [Melghirimyces algeriensis]